MKKLLRRELPFSVALVAAALMVFCSSTRETRSALKIESEQYDARVSVKGIGVTLKENGVEIARRDNDYNESNNIKTNSWSTDVDRAVAAGGTFFGSILSIQPGKNNDVALTVKNSGEIDTYVRLILRRYWVEDADKRVNLDPEKINITVNTSDWILDESWKEEKNPHPETLVLYYKGNKGVLSPEAETSSAIVSIQVDKDVMLPEEYDNSRTVALSGGETGHYIDFVTYDNVGFTVEVEADAVQTHNATAAMKSAWGISDDLIGRIMKG